jgi:hypothetical protein
MFGFAHLARLFSKSLVVALAVGMIAAPAALGERQEPLNFANGPSKYGSLDPWAYNAIHKSKYGSLDPWAYNAIRNAQLNRVEVPSGDSRSLDPRPEQLLAASRAHAVSPSKYGSLDPWAYNAIHKSKYGSLDPWAYNAIRNAQLNRAEIPSGDSRSLDPTPEQLLAASRVSAPTPSAISVDEGFDWADAGIGAGGAFSFVLLIGGTALVLRRGRGHVSSV